VVYSKLKFYFDTDANHQLYHKAWQFMEFSTVKKEYPDKIPAKALELIFNKL
jgi:hypothetical protein